MKQKNKFKVELSLDKLLAVPYAQGHFFVKVKMLKGSYVCGVSDRQQVSNHEVVWNQTMKFETKLYTDVSGTLIPCFVQASIKQETNGGKSSVKLGVVIFDLALFAQGGHISKRYLLQAGNGAEVKENSVLKIAVKMTQVAGDPVFRTKPFESDDIHTNNNDDADQVTPKIGTLIELSELDQTVVEMQDIANLTSEGTALAPSEFQEWRRTRVAADEVVDHLLSVLPPVWVSHANDVEIDQGMGLTSLLFPQTSMGSLSM